MVIDMIGLLIAKKIRFKLDREDFIHVGNFSFMKTIKGNYGLFINNKFVKTTSFCKIKDILEI